MATASREFLVMAKPAGPICNLDCKYCYYLPRERLYPEGEAFRMPEELLERYIVQQIEASPSPAIVFQWHGGEPTILGLDYFRLIVALQRKHRPAGRKIVNGIQTNGTLLDEEWCRFFAAEGFLVGLSLDGPEDLHDRYRVTKGQRPTHKQVVRAFRLLQRYGVECDLLCTVHDHNVHSPTAVYHFFKEIGAQRLQFLPIVEAIPCSDGGVSPRTVPSEAYGSFLCTIFDEWVRIDIGRVHVQIFDEALKWACDIPRALCVVRETCGDIPVVEHNGDVFACDHFVDPAHLLGNIRETPLAELVDSPRLLAFGQAKRDTLPRYCRGCKILDFCNGGCPKDRIIRTPDGDEGMNYLCAGMKRFFFHIRPYVLELAQLWRAGQPLDRLMDRVAAADAAASAQAGRNDPCPCGSGRKYKKCCLGKAH
jgi:uncharacterized protein